MLGLLQVLPRGKRLDGASTPSSAPPSPTAGLRRNLSSSDLLGASAKAAAFERKKGGMGAPRKWVRFDRNSETSVIQARPQHSVKRFCKVCCMNKHTCNLRPKGAQVASGRTAYRFVVLARPGSGTA